MKNIVSFILFIVSIFIINIVFYYSSENYRDFLKRVKIESSVQEEQKSSSKPDFLLKNNENSYFSWVLKENKKEESLEKKEEQKDKNINIKKEVKLWKWYQGILDMFSEYNLTKLDVNANLFDLTNEYPDSYYEFYSKRLTLYFFTSKNYEQVFDIFNVLQTDLPFKINKTNNFWNNSFYINFNNDINDSFIRIVIENNWIVFWLKIDKNEYENIKQKLQNLRNN